MEQVNGTVHAGQDCNVALVDLLSTLELSLLQYVSEAELWTDATHADATSTLGRLANGQRQSVGEAAELLARRRLLPELENFPSAYAQLHYLALDYVLDRLIEDQQGVVAVANEAIAECTAAKAMPDLKRIRDREAGHLAELQRLCEKRS